MVFDSYSRSTIGVVIVVVVGGGCLIPHSEFITILYINYDIGIVYFVVEFWKSEG